MILDKAIAALPKILCFLQQRKNEAPSFSQTRDALLALPG
jgi:flagellar biosynthesis/type III secretory pathway ATPase